MPQLVVRQIEEKVVKKLKEQAGQHGVSMEEEHRRILRAALVGASKKKPSFKEYVQGILAFDAERGRGQGFCAGAELERPIEL
jgi:plasmid stability protein